MNIKPQSQEISTFCLMPSHLK